MGNIEHRKMKSLFPSSQNLDNPSTKSEENQQHSSQSFTTSYDPKRQSLLQMTLTDNAQIQMILSNISLYTQQSRTAFNPGYASISSLKDFYKVKKDGYCTQQYIFYLIFQGCSCCGLKDEFGVRKMMSKKFTDQQILSILKTYLAGIFIYIKQFKRNIQKIDLDDIGFEVFNSVNDQHLLNQNQQNIVSSQKQNKRKIRIFFTEPWLKQKRQQEIITVNEVNILLQNPSPQRLKSNSKIVEKFNQIDEKQKYIYANDSQKSFLSLLFSIGVIGLKLLQMGFVDDIYMRTPSKRVNFQRIKNYLEKHQPASNNNSNKNLNNGVNYDFSVSKKKLISGLRILLLSNSPEERQRIYEFWSVKLDDKNYLDEINLQYSDHFQTGREEATHSLQGNEQNIPMAGTHRFPVENHVRPKTKSRSGKLYEVENSSLNWVQPQANHKISQKTIIVQKEQIPNRNYVYKLDHMKPLKVQNTQILIHNTNHPMPIQNSQQIYQPNNQNYQFPLSSQKAFVQNSIVLERITSRNQQPKIANQQSLVLGNPTNGQMINTHNYQSFSYGGQNIISKPPLLQKLSNQGSVFYNVV